MRLFVSLLAALPFALGACVNQPPTKENMLAQAGFKTLPIKNEAQLAHFRSIQPHWLTKTSYKGKTVWVYADQAVCGCMYVGTQAAYDRYIGIATRTQAAENLRSDRSDSGYVPTAAMLDAGPWDDAEALGLYLN
jgi:hypothetical protein